MNLVTLESIDSTNKYAQYLLEQGIAVDKTVVLSLEQTAGKGQRGKFWLSQAGLGIYASIVLVPIKKNNLSQFFLNKAIAVGVSNYIQSLTDEDVRIKWPNDIMINDSKVAGLLIETNFRGSNLVSLIAGIGINLNHISFDGHFETPPISIKMITQKHYNPKEEIGALFSLIMEEYEIFLQGNYQEIDERYQANLYKKNVPAAYIRTDGVFTGILQYVDNEGVANLLEDGLPIKASHPETRFFFGGGLND